MKKLIVLSGAGMSAESGIATFRDAGGLWEQHRIEDVATPEAFRRNPELVHRFYNLRRKQLMEAKPNAGHYGLVELEHDFDVLIITQNVDNLHERAGSSKVLHLHGELMKMRSTGQGEEIIEVSDDKLEYGVGDLCPLGYPLRPHIVWFGEMVPEMETAMEWMETADIVLVVGTSLQVYPAAGLLHYAPPGADIYLIDPNEVRVDRRGVELIRQGASEGIATFARIIKGK